MKHYILILSILLIGLMAKGQYTLTDSDVTMDGSGTITNCSYSFEQTDLIIPETLDGQAVTGIGYSVFANKGITSVSMEHVTSFGYFAFEDNEITSLSLPNADSIGYYAFSGNQITSINLPNTSYIDSHAFSGNDLTSISLPNVITIDGFAFDSNQLTSIDLPLVTTLGPGVFNGNNLTSINLPNLTYMGIYTFCDNQITNISLPSITHIGVRSFLDNPPFNFQISEHNNLDFICFKSSANQYYTFGDALVDVDETYDAYYGSHETACESYTSPGGNIWTEVGFYEELYSETDTTVVTYLTINDPVSVASQPTAVNACLGAPATFSVTVNGPSPTYQWLKAGSEITGATNSTYTLPVAGLADEGLFSCEIDNMCNLAAISEGAELKVIEMSIDAGIADTICLNSNTQLQASANSNYPDASGVIYYSWSPEASLNDENISNPIASPMVTTSYFVTATDENACQSIENVDVYVQNVDQTQQLCLVTVDSATGKNKLVWEANENAGTESYLIQKAMSSNTYSTLGIVDASETSEFIDIGSDPAAHSDFYKITVMDTCGNVSDIDNSVYHKTINLTLSNVGSTMSLNWEQYEVEDGSYVPATYKIYRGADASNMEVIDEINGMLSSYNDLDVNQVYHYMVASVREDCTPNSDRSINVGYEIFSNQENNEALITGMLEKRTYLPITLYPNPASTEIIIENLELKSNSNVVRITDVSGKVVKEFLYERSIHKIQINDLLSGTYFLTITGHKIYRSKFVKY